MDLQGRAGMIADQQVALCIRLSILDENGPVARCWVGDVKTSRDLREEGLQISIPHNPVAIISAAIWIRDGQ